MERSRTETYLAWFSVVSAVVHFAGETAYHVQYGQFLPMLLVDYIAVALNLFAAWRSLRCRSASAAGLLAGAWGFTFCLNYVAFFLRVEDRVEGAAAVTGEPDAVVVVLGGLLVLSGAAFAVSLFLANPRR